MKFELEKARAKMATDMIGADICRLGWAGLPGQAGLAGLASRASWPAAMPDGLAEPAGLG